MPRATDWVNSKRAAEIMSDAMGRQITTNYIRVLRHTGAFKNISSFDARTPLYDAKEIEAYGLMHNKELKKQRRAAAAAASK